MSWMLKKQKKKFQFATLYLSALKRKGQSESLVKTIWKKENLRIKLLQRKEKERHLFD